MPRSIRLRTTMRCSFGCRSLNSGCGSWFSLLVLIARCPLRGVKELLSSLFDYDMSVGNVHNIVQDAVSRARRNQ